MARRLTGMAALEDIASRLPEVTRVDVAAWDGEPTFRVGGKTFVFADPDGSSIAVKLPRDEAEALVATDPRATPTGHGLGRAGWVTVDLGGVRSRAGWAEVEEWVRTSYRLVAPRRLAGLVTDDPPEAGARPG